MGVSSNMLTIFTLMVVLGAIQGSRLEGTCAYDRDCDAVVENTYCDRQERCSCMEGYKSDVSKEKCIANVGAICRSDRDCQSLQYSECRQGVCDCQRHYVPHPDQNSCLPEAAAYRFPCLEDIQCQSKFGDTGTCYQDKCVCQPRYHYFDGKCIPNIGLGSSCNVTGECYIDEETLNMVHCNENKKCECRVSFQEHDKTCTGEGSQLVLSYVMVLLSLILVQVVV